MKERLAWQWNAWNSGQPYPALSKPFQHYLKTRSVPLDWSIKERQLRLEHHSTPSSTTLKVPTAGLENKSQHGWMPSVVEQPDDHTAVWEFIKNTVRPWQTTPERSLLLAILEDAIYLAQDASCHCTEYMAKVGRGRAIQKKICDPCAARQWISSDAMGDDSYFAYRRICEEFDFSFEYLRKCIFAKEMKAIQTQRGVYRHRVQQGPGNFKS